VSCWLLLARRQTIKEIYEDAATGAPELALVSSGSWTKENRMSTGPSAPPGEQPGDAAPQQVGDRAHEKAQELAGQAQQQAQQAAGMAKGRLRQELDQRSSQVADQISQQASDLRAVGDSLREQGKDRPAGAAAKLAGYGEKVGGYLRERDSDTLLADAEDFGRRQPWAVAAGAVAAGFAASRFLKASSSRRYATRSSVPRSEMPSAPAPPSGL
jgi:hypothetical protein